MTGGNMTGLNLNCRNLACNKLNLNLVIAVVTSNWLWAWNNAKWKKGWVNTFWRENLHLQFPPEWLLNKKKTCQKFSCPSLHHGSAFEVLLFEIISNIWHVFLFLVIYLQEFYSFKTETVYFTDFTYCIVGYFSNSTSAINEGPLYC